MSIASAAARIHPDGKVNLVGKDSANFSFIIRVKPALGKCSGELVHHLTDVRMLDHNRFNVSCCGLSILFDACFCNSRTNFSGVARVDDDVPHRRCFPIGKVILTRLSNVGPQYKVDGITLDRGSFLCSSGHLWIVDVLAQLDCGLFQSTQATTSMDPMDRQ
jgi:hypothetical protein